MAGVAQLAALIGRTARWTIYAQSGLYPLTIPVVIIDARERYGTRDVKIEPVGGSGERWVEMGSVEVDPPPLSPLLNR